MIMTKPLELDLTAKRAAPTGRPPSTKPIIPSPIYLVKSPPADCPTNWGSIDGGVQFQSALTAPFDSVRDRFHRPRHGELGMHRRVGLEH